MMRYDILMADWLVLEIKKVTERKNDNHSFVKRHCV